MGVESTRHLQVELEGSPEDGGAVRLSDFYQFLQQLTQTLAAIERDVTGGGRASLVYRVVQLSYASPVRLTLEASVPEGQPDIAPAVVERFARGVDCVSKGVEPREFSMDALERLEGIGAAYKKHIRDIRVFTADTQVELPADFEARVKRILGNVFRTHGSFRGHLEVVNLHSDPCAVHIYPVAGPNRVRCTFRRGSIANIGDLLEQFVEVFGVLKFRGDHPHPFEIEAERISAVPPQSSLPSTNEIVGSMPGLTGGRSPASYLRILRDEEEAA